MITCLAKTLHHAAFFDETGKCFGIVMTRATTHDLPKLRRIRMWLRLMKDFVEGGEIERASEALAQHGWVMSFDRLLSLFWTNPALSPIEAAARARAERELHEFDQIYATVELDGWWCGGDGPFETAAEACRIHHAMTV